MNNKITFEVAKEFKGVGGDFYSYENGEEFETLEEAQQAFDALDTDPNEKKVINQIERDQDGDIIDVEQIQKEA